MTALTGVYPILNTTFTDEGALDLASQTQLIHHLLAAGAHGFGLFGNASEGYALTAAERRVLLACIREAVGGRVPLVVSTGHTGTDAAVELSREAEGEGADALMVLPPYFLKPDADGIRFYFDAISRAVNIPIMVQDAPLLTQVALPAPLLSRLAKECEQVRYVKVEAPPTAPKVTAVRDGSDLVIFGGLNGQFLIEETIRGARGVMPGSDLIAEFVTLWNHLEAGETADAWQLFTRILPLIRFELQPGLGVSAMKHNLQVAGVIRSARVRHPTATLDRESLRELAMLREVVSAAPVPAH